MAGILTYMCHVDTTNEDSAVSRQCNNASRPLSADGLTNVARARRGVKGEEKCSGDDDDDDGLTLSRLSCYCAAAGCDKHSNSSSYTRGSNCCQRQCCRNTCCCFFCCCCCCCWGCCCCCCLANTHTTIAWSAATAYKGQRRRRPSFVGCRSSVVACCCCVAGAGRRHVAGCRRAYKTGCYAKQSHRTVSRWRGQQVSCQTSSNLLACQIQCEP